jgi:predicted amidohydrolase
MRVATIQMEMLDRSKAENWARADYLLDRARGADLILMPEIWNIGYFSFNRYREDSEGLEGETASRMSRWAKELGAYLFAGSLVEKAGENCYNTALFFGPDGEILASYRKIHLFGYGSQESQILTPGLDPVVVETPIGKFGITTCYDLRFPELYRILMAKGAQMFLVTSAWPFPRLEHWIMFNRTRAIENVAFLASSNCVGRNAGVHFCGHSMIVDPWGVVIAGAGDEECVVRTEVDLDKVADVRQVFPALQDIAFPVGS